MAETADDSWGRLPGEESAWGRATSLRGGRGPTGAACAGRRDRVPYLYGCEPNAVDKSGVAPLHRAVRTRPLPP